MSLKITKPTISIEKLEDFFSTESNFKLLEKPSAKNEVHFRARLKKHAAAVLWYLDQGKIRVWSPTQQTTNTWVKQGILSYFPTHNNAAMSAGVFEYLDKMPVKKRSAMKGVRVVPGGIVRMGSFVEAGVIVMPGFVNVGAYVAKGTMVDTWATVGSCAQIGENVHLSGGVGIGGVLEPAQAAPVIVEDHAFLGSRCIVVEGVRVRREAVLGAGVVLTASTKIIDVTGSKPVVLMGEVPERSVVIPGSLPKEFAAGTYQVPCALIIGKRKPSTDTKTSLNAALRDFSVSV
jgi:2,3,4,5-tetrahydropyridine-2-carboxylate N-succinyltransferase